MNTILLPKIISHRGANNLAPENTKSSIKKASLLGASFVEIDIKISKDEIPILLHDDTIDRTTNGSGLCCDYNYEDLVKLDAGSWFNKKFKNEKVLTLDECLDLLSELNMGVNIELKPNKNKEKNNVIKIRNLLNKKKFKNEYFFSSFDYYSIDIISKEMPLIPRGLLVENNINNKNFSLESILDLLKRYNCFSIGFEKNLINKELVQFFKNQGYAITVFTINDKQFAKEIFSWGVDSIFTDELNKFKEFINQ